MANFCSRIAEAATRAADRTAIDTLRASGVETTSYRALLDQSVGFAAWLVAHGCARGDRVAILADNDAHWIACYLGVLRLGAVVVPLDTAYKKAQVQTILRDSGARVLFTTPRYAETAQAAVALAGDAAPMLRLLGDELPAVPGTPLPIADAADADAAVILYTSGTTADPKGVVLTHANLDAERLGVLGIVHVTPDDSVLGVLPLFHALAQMANLLLPLSVGARVVFLETVSSTTLLEALQSQRITIFACVPQFFYLIHQRVTAEVGKKGAVARGIFRALMSTNGWLRDRLRVNPGRRIFARVHAALGPTMRVLVTGGSRFDPAIGRDLYGLGFTLLNGYGLTETSGGATIIRPDDVFSTSVGQPLPGVDVKIDTTRAMTDDDAKGAASGAQASGEILIRGPIIMREYFNRPDATAAALVDGWLRTGDLGRLDDKGRLYITGRLKEIIVLSSGKNLYPEEIEAHYRQSSFIKELCVLGMSRPDEPSAERLHAVIVPDEQILREKGIVNLRELIRFEIEGLSVQIPAHKRILSYDISLEPLPRTTTGKLRRHQIEKQVRENAAPESGADTRPVSDADRTWLADSVNAGALAAIARQVQRPDVRPDANLELDLGLDSMERVELLTMLERQQGTQVKPEVRATIFTTRQLVDAVRGAAPRGGTAAGTDADATADAGVAWEQLLAEPPNRAIVDDLARPKRLTAVVLFVVIKVIGIVAIVLLRRRVTGRDRLPREGPFVLCPNHLAYLDGFVIASVLPFRVLRQLFFVGASEYLETPFMKWMARTMNIVPVDPDAQLVNAMRAGMAGLRLKKVLMLFPEGERSIDGTLKPFRKGAAILASHAGAPIVPVALDGLFELWPRGRSFNWSGLLPWRAAPVSVAFGEPVQVPRGDYTGGMDQVRSSVAAMLNTNHSR